MSKTTNRALLYVAWNAGTFALANLSVAMFGDGTLSWAKFRFAWVIFILGLVISAVGVLRAFIDQTPSQEAAELAALAAALPAAGPDTSGAARSLAAPPTPAPKAPPAAAGLSEAGAADPRALLLLAACCLLAGCATLAAIQRNPGVQAAETAGIAIGGTLATGQPAFAYLAPIVVNGLTAMADGSNPTAVSGSDLAADASLITQTVVEAVPNSAGKTAAVQIAQAYTTAMAQPGVPQTATGANAVIGAIASGLAAGANAAATTTAAARAQLFREQLARGQIAPGDYAELIEMRAMARQAAHRRGIDGAMPSRSVACRQQYMFFPAFLPHLEMDLTPAGASLRFRNRLPDLRDEEREPPRLMIADNRD